MASPVVPKCPDKPNVLVVVIDTLRYDASQIDPKSRNTTPFLAGLRERAVTFTNAYSTADSTPGSHFSILTGYLLGWQGPLDVPEASVAHQLRRIGYRSFGVSANGNLSPASYRLAQSFDRYTCLQDVFESMPEEEKVSAIAAADRRIRHYGAEPDAFSRLIVWSSARQVLPRVRKMLDRTRKPFYGFVNFIDVHDPYLPDPRYYSQKRENATVALLRSRTLPPELHNPDIIGDEKRREVVKTTIANAFGRAWSTSLDLTPTQIGVYKRRYLAEVRQIDARIRELFTMLDQRGLLDDTIVILTSDHGEAFGEDGFMTHSLNTPGTREATNHVPLLVLFPPCYRIAPRVVDHPTTIADIVPTIYDLVRIDSKKIAQKSSPGFFGRSLMPYLCTSPQKEKTAVAGSSDFKEPLPNRKKQEDDEALRRLRSLGYLR